MKAHLFWIVRKNNSFKNYGHKELVLLANRIFKHLRLSLADSFSRVLAWLTKARVTKKGSNIPEQRIFLFLQKNIILSVNAYLVIIMLFSPY